MPEINTNSEPSDTNEDETDRCDINWESIARQELGVAIHQQLWEVEDLLNTIIGSIQNGDSVDPERIQSLRTELEQLENTVTCKLVQIDELDQTSHAEQFTRLGHRMVQQFHTLARDERREIPVDQAHITETEAVLEEAETFLKEYQEQVDIETIESNACEDPTRNSLSSGERE